MKIQLIATALLATALFSACSKGSKSSLKTEADTLSYEFGMTQSVDEDQLKMYLADPRTGSDSAYVEEFMKGMKDGLSAATDKKKVAYYAGLQAAAQMRMTLGQIEETVFVGADSTKHLSTKHFLAGFRDGVEGKKTKLKIDGQLINKESAQADFYKRISAMRAKAMAKEYAPQIKAAEAYMAKKAKEPGISKLPGGTLYKVITAGTGAKVKDGQQVQVIYEGSLTDGTVFDKSEDHARTQDKTMPMVVGQSIPGFDEALKAMPIGSTWEVYIPYNQGYNEQGGGAITPFSNLVFKITLVGVSTPAQTAPASASSTVEAH